MVHWKGNSNKSLMTITDCHVIQIKTRHLGNMRSTYRSVTQSPSPANLNAVNA